MTYPKVSTTGQHTGAAFGVPASPRFPQVEEAVLAHWAADDTFRASVEQRSPGGRRSIDAWNVSSRSHRSSTARSIAGRSGCESTSG